MEVKPRSLVRSISISLRTRFKVVCPVVLARAIESSIIEEEKKVFANYLQHSSVGTTPMERKGFRQAHTILENHIRNMDTGYLILESDVQYKSGYISKWYPVLPALPFSCRRVLGCIPLHGGHLFSFFEL
jgi:hypothetical protein